MAGDTEDRGIGDCPDCLGLGVAGGPGSYYDTPSKGKPCARCAGRGKVFECPPWCEAKHIHLRLRGY